MKVLRTDADTNATVSIQSKHSSITLNAYHVHTAIVIAGISVLPMVAHVWRQMCVFFFNPTTEFKGTAQHCAGQPAWSDQLCGSHMSGLSKEHPELEIAMLFNKIDAVYRGWIRVSRKES
jgi:hypothetical protein